MGPFHIVVAFGYTWHYLIPFGRSLETEPFYTKDGKLSRWAPTFIRRTHP